MKNNKGRISIFTFILIIILIVIFVGMLYIYKTNNFIGFDKATREPQTTKFSRDFQTKYSEKDSYKIENTEYNDSTFYKEIEVEPNTPYRITCMVKTENVECELENVDGGATIGVLDTVQYCKPITGTNDWQQMEFIFNSKKETKVKISFRLGGNQNNCKGIAWFSNLKLEKGIKNKDSEWNVGCFLINEIDVNIEGEKYNLKLNMEDKENVRLNLERYKNDCYEFSNKKMTVNYEIKEIYEPITSLTYSEEFGYHIAPEDVSNIIYETAKENKYDHIFVVSRMENDKRFN